MNASMPLTPDARELLSLLAYVYLENNRPEKTAVVLNALRTLGLADKVLADKKALEALLVKLQASMEEDREKIKSVMQAMDESMQMVSKMINATAESMSQVTANIGKRAMV